MMTMTQEHAARRLEVNGIVQGVGFRHFVYNLAIHFGLKGEVANTSTGVSIHIEGPLNRIQSFETDLTAKCPPLAHIVEISSRSESVKQYPDFNIVKSRGQATMSTFISPDV